MMSHEEISKQLNEIERVMVLGRAAGDEQVFDETLGMIRKLSNKLAVQLNRERERQMIAQAVLADIPDVEEKPTPSLMGRVRAYVLDVSTDAEDPTPACDIEADVRAIFNALIQKGSYSDQDIIKEAHEYYQSK